MLPSFRHRWPAEPVWLSRIFWTFWHALCYIWFLICYRFRSYGVKHVPKDGTLLVVSNHQSFFDPIILGLPLVHRRPFVALARKTLFKNKFFAWFIRSLEALPVDQEASDLKAMRQCIDVLKTDKALIMYPEGSRTLTGKTEAFQPGFMLLLKRAKPTILPVAIEGAFDVWPRKSKRFKLFGKISVNFGEPIKSEDVLAMGSDEALAYLQQTVEDLRLELVEKH